MAYLNEEFDFEEKIRLIEGKLLLSALSILKNEEDAKDALQETVYIAYKKINQLKEIGLFNFWVSKILIRETYKIYNRRKNIVMNHEDIENYFPAEVNHSDIEFFDMVTELKKQEKVIIILRFYNDFSLEEVSRILKIPLSTVKYRYYQSLKKIKQKLEARNDGL